MDERQRESERDVIWYLQVAETEACGLKATAWTSFLEEAGDGAAGGKARTVQVRDAFPDWSDSARERFRRIHAVWCALPPAEQAVLHARYNHQGVDEGCRVPGLGECSRVGALLQSVRNKATRKRTTPHAVLLTMAQRKSAQAATLLEECEELVSEALRAFGELYAVDRDKKRSARAARLAAIRGAA